LSKWLETLRDRIVARSQLGKRKLDAAVTRREVDRKLVNLGEQFLKLIRAGRLEVPSELTSLVREARELEDRLERQRQEIVTLKSESG